MSINCEKSFTPKGKYAILMIYNDVFVCERTVIFLKKALIMLVAALVCYFINIWLGLLVTAVFVIYFGYKYLPDICAVMGSRAYVDKGINPALRWYRRALATKRASDKIKISYALLLLRTGSPEAAEKQFDEVIVSKSAKAEDKRAAKQYRCMAYCKEGRMDEAMEDATALFAEVKNTLTYGIMGYFMHLLDAPTEETLALCEEGYSYNSDDRDITDNLVLALIRCGELERAKELAASLRENHPHFVEAYYHSALIEQKLGNNEAAREYLSHIPDCKRTYLTTISEEEISALSKEVE